MAAPLAPGPPIRRIRRFLRRHPRHAGLAALATGLALSEVRLEAVLTAGGAIAALVGALRLPLLGLALSGLLLVGTIIGAARLDALHAPDWNADAGRLATTRAHLLERPRSSRFGSSAALRIVSGQARGAKVLARTPRQLRWPPDTAVGAELEVSGFLRPPRSSPGAKFDFPAYLRRRGIAAELALDSIRPTGARRGGPAGLVDAIRARAERGIAAGLSRSEAALARGMVLGQDEAVSAPVREDFRASGLAHLLRSYC